MREYPFWRIAIGSSIGDFKLESRLPLIESIPTDEITRSNEWTTRGNKMKPDGSAQENGPCMSQFNTYTNAHTHNCACECVRTQSNINSSTLLAFNFTMLSHCSPKNHSTNYFGCNTFKKISASSCTITHIISNLDCKILDEYIAKINVSKQPTRM